MAKLCYSFIFVFMCCINVQLGQKLFRNRCFENGNIKLLTKRSVMITEKLELVKMLKQLLLIGRNTALPPFTLNENRLCTDLKTCLVYGKPQELHEKLHQEQRTLINVFLVIGKSNFCLLDHSYFNFTLCRTAIIRVSQLQNILPPFMDFKYNNNLSFDPLFIQNSNTYILSVLNGKFEFISSASSICCENINFDTLIDANRMIKSKLTEPILNIYSFILPLLTGNFPEKKILTNNRNLIQAWKAIKNHNPKLFSLFLDPKDLYWPTFVFAENAKQEIHPGVFLYLDLFIYLPSKEKRSLFGWITGQDDKQMNQLSHNSNIFNKNFQIQQANTRALMDSQRKLSTITKQLNFNENSMFIGLQQLSNKVQQSLIESHVMYMNIKLNMDQFRLASDYNNIFNILTVVHQQIKQYLQSLIVANYNCNLHASYVYCPLSEATFDLTTDVIVSFKALQKSFEKVSFLQCLPFQTQIFSAHGQQFTKFNGIYKSTSTNFTFSEKCFLSHSECSGKYIKSNFTMFNTCNIIALKTTTYVNCAQPLTLTTADGMLLKIDDEPTELPFSKFPLHYGAQTYNLEHLTLQLTDNLPLAIDKNEILTRTLQALQTPIAPVHIDQPQIVETSLPDQLGNILEGEDIHPVTLSITLTIILVMFIACVGIYCCLRLCSCCANFNNQLINIFNKCCCCVKKEPDHQLVVFRTDTEQASVIPALTTATSVHSTSQSTSAANTETQTDLENPLWPYLIPTGPGNSQSQSLPATSSYLSSTTTGSRTVTNVSTSPLETPIISSDIQPKQAKRRGTKTTVTPNF